MADAKFYATDPKNIFNFEIGNKSATCGPAATNTSKVKHSLIPRVKMMERVYEATRAPCKKIGSTKTLK